MRLAGIMAACLFGASCFGAPPPVEPDLPVDVPGAWTADPARSGEVAEAWWRSFRDPALENLLGEALRNNQNLKLAAERISNASAQARLVLGDMLPNLSAGFDGAKRKQVFVGIPIPGGPDVLKSRSEQYGLTGYVSWEIDLWGRIRAAHSAALAEVEAEEAEFVGAQLSLLAATAKTYFIAIEADRQLALAEATLKSYRATNERIRQRYLRGLRPSIDLRLSLANVAAGEELVHQTRQQRDAAFRALELLLGRYPAARINVRGALPDVPPPAPAGLPVEILSRRPDLIAAERRVAASNARMREATLTLLPRITLTGSLGTTSNEVGDLLDGDFSVWSIAGNALQPFFQGGKILAGISLATSGQRQALAGYVDRALNAFADVENALSAEKHLADQEKATASAAREAAKAHEISEDRYNRGVGHIITLLESQRRAFSAESRLITVRRMRLEARVNLHLALGGGFEPTGNESGETSDDPGK